MSVRRLARRDSMLHRAAARTLPPVERVVGGGQIRERVLIALLRSHYRSAFRRQWLWTATVPHFYPQRWTAFEVVFPGCDGDVLGPYPLFRGFYNAEILHDGDRMLDIGSGDGFYASRFYASRCAHVDAVDINEEALRTARRFSGHPRVAYHLGDVIADPFPTPPYDVIAWDGGIGHLAATGASAVLQKIAEALALGGVFTGSESVGHVRDADHLQTFADVSALAGELKPWFELVRTKELTYRVGDDTRREAFWRCATVGPNERLVASDWRSH